MCALTPAAAAEKNCGELSTQMEMNVCEGEKFKKADAALNDAYARLAKKVSAEGRTKLVETQRAWLKYRDQQCAFETLGTMGGSIHGMVAAICQTALTEAQTKRLRAQVDCEEGDVSCGGQ
jgi:uncharacterized protein YecT (DUF1311 family)